MSSAVRVRIASAASAATFLSTYFREAPMRGYALALRRLGERLKACPATIWIDCVKQLIDRDPAHGGELLASALSLHPTDPTLLRLRASVFVASGDVDGAEYALRRAIAEAPDDEDAAFELAGLLREQARFAAAAAVLMGLRPRSRDTRSALATSEFLASCDRHDDAYVTCIRELAEQPGSTAMQLEAGTQALVLGRFEQARGHLRAALSAPAPEWGATLPLALCRQCTSPEDEDLKLFRKIWTNETVPPALRAPSGFALAKALDDLSLIDEAALVFRAANAMVDSEQPWSTRNWQDFIELQLAQNIVPLAAPVLEGVAPVFIVGLPRSGTTLAAELLSRHAGVCNRGELNWISFLSEQLAIRRQFQNPHALAEAAQQYLRHLRRDDPPAQYYIDKNPLNFRHIGLIAALFPNARIIHCRRSERDTALSLWTQLFDHPENAYAYRLENILAFMRGHQRLMSAIVPRLRLPVFDLHYESLVRDPVEKLAALAAFVGLPPSSGRPDELPPAKDNHAISTASVWQARQPITANSIGRADRYLAAVPELAQFSD